jgi:hypothetical protein
VRDGGRWRLLDAEGAVLGEADVVIAALPAPGAARLLAPHAPALAARADAAVMQPCWATMVVFDGAVDAPWDGAFVNDDPVLAWAVRDGSKPHRPEPHAWVLHGTRAWSGAHDAAAPDTVRDAMLGAFATLVGAPLPPVLEATAHRWRHALPDPVLAEDALHDPTLGLGACGDWCGGPRVEGALLSGIAAAGRVLVAAHLADDAHAARAPGAGRATDLGPLFGASAHHDPAAPPVAG